MADEMPLYVREILLHGLQGLYLGIQFLGTALSEDPLPGTVCLYDRFNWMELGYSDKSHP